MEATRRFTVSVTRPAGAPAGAKVAQNPRDRAALQREVAVLGALTHPGIVELLEVGETQTSLCVLTRLAGVHTLATASAVGPVLGVARVGQLFASLGALHGRGLAHGSVCATHVVVTPTGAVRWCGLGRCSPALPDQQAEECSILAALAQTELHRVRPFGHRARHGRALLGAAAAVIHDDRLDAVGRAMSLAGLLDPWIPALRRDVMGRRGVMGRRSVMERSAKADGDLVGQQATGNREHQVPVTLLDEPTQRTGEVAWWER